MRLIQLGLTALMLMGIVGGYAAALGWHDGVFLMLAWALITFGWHLVLGLLSYRAVMTRPWPQVAALADDDPWDD